MKKKISCLHAHYSNIEYIQQASDQVEWIHFVDPGLMNRIAYDPHFNESAAKNKVIEQVEWIAQTNPDALLITCTQYIALLEEDRLNTTIPIIKIDEPFFQRVCACNEPQVLLFTNPATVDGTMRRLHEYAAKQGTQLSEVRSHVMENTFEWIMQGNKERYVYEVSQYMKKLIASDSGSRISVAQLSMVEAANIVECETGVPIGNPMQSLAAFLELI
jgi:glutamate racemase